MTVLTQFVVVRRDLPLGLVLAMVAHAAGEAFYRLHGQAHETECDMGDSCCRGPACFDPAQTIAVVKGARNEQRLMNLAAKLRTAVVDHVVITETDGEYAGQVMAIGLVPVAREHVARMRAILNDFQFLTSCRDV